MRPLAVIGTAVAGLLVSAGVTAYLAWTLAAGVGATVWLAPGFGSMEVVAWFVPPSTDAAEGWHALLALSISWLFWGMVPAILMVIARRSRRSAI